MPDREKVIKGLTECVAAGLEKACPANCPYFLQCFPDAGLATPFMSLMADALSLLKEQEAKTGHWIEKEDYNLDTYYDCSVCGESWTMIDGTPWENGMNYCPHCGARMINRG